MKIQLIFSNKLIQPQNIYLNQHYFVYFEFISFNSTFISVNISLITNNS
jgi:hypothetical protein